MKIMKRKLIEAHEAFMQVEVKGYNIDPMYKGLCILTEVINGITESEEKNEVSDID